MSEPRMTNNQDDWMGRALKLEAALRLFRSLVKEGGVPRYTITPGAAFNTLIEETIDPLLR